MTGAEILGAIGLGLVVCGAGSLIGVGILLAIDHIRARRRAPTPKGV